MTKMGTTKPRRYRVRMVDDRVRWMNDLSRAVDLLKIGAARHVTAPHDPLLFGQLTLDLDAWPRLPADPKYQQAWRDVLALTVHYLPDDTCEACNQPARLCGHRSPETRDPR